MRCCKACEHVGVRSIKFATASISLDTDTTSTGKMSPLRDTLYHQYISTNLDSLHSNTWNIPKLWILHYH